MNTSLSYTPRIPGAEPIYYDPALALPPDEACEPLAGYALDALRYHRYLSGEPAKPVRLLVPGCGPGTLACAFLAHVQSRSDEGFVAGPVDVVGFDINSHALDLADYNFGRYEQLGGVSVRLFEGSWEDAAMWHQLDGEPANTILVNPPYLPVDERIRPGYEATPAEALYAGDDGLDAYRAILRHAPASLASGPAATLIGRYGVPGARQNATNKLRDMVAAGMGFDPASDSLRMLPTEGSVNYGDDRWLSLFIFQREVPAGDWVNGQHITPEGW